MFDVGRSTFDAPLDPNMTAPSPQSRVLTLKNKRTMPTWLAAPLAGLLKTWGGTCRVDVVDPHGFYDAARFPAIFAVWHNRVPLLATMLKRDMKRRLTVLISASRDGNYGAALGRYLGIEPVRGSSSKGGMRALRDLLRVLGEGKATVITLDGPRGPRYEVHPGVVLLARKSGVPIVPVSLNAPRRWQLRSWDQTQFAKPFSRVELRFGAPLRFPADERVDMDDAKRQLRQAMLAVTRDKRR
jgi:lysophospholipid acyltransferase (LPLAT)-like uncharacterized protein